MKTRTFRILTVVCLAAGLVGLLAIVCLALRPTPVPPDDPPGGDWPQWRHDASHGATSPRELPGALHLRWIRQLPPPRPAWPASQPWLRFDLSYAPVAAGKTLFVPSMVADSVTAYDTDTGAEKWRFYTGAPVRFAPIAHRGKVYFGSDDGYLYCLDAAGGSLKWRRRGGPSDRKVLGNERLISTWPVRGGPVLFEGTVYFTAGIWPFMGIFVRAVDAETGRAVWTNSGAGSTYTTQPHNSPAFAGLAPRGHLAATEEGLIVPGGRTQPGCYDLKTGKFRYFHFGPKNGGSHHVSARDQWFFTDGAMARIADGEELLRTPATVHDDQALYSIDQGGILAQQLQPNRREIERKDRKGNIVRSTEWYLAERWRAPAAEVPGRLFIKAGSRFVAGREGVVALVEAGPGNRAAKVVWKGTIEGKPWTMLAADNKLFVVTVEGRIYCFGATPGPAKTYGDVASPGPPPAKHTATSHFSAGTSAKVARSIIETTRMTAGYGVMFGLDGPLAESLVRSSKLYLIVIDPDAKKIDAFRRRMDDTGLYGTRIAADTGNPAEYALPPYCANLVVVKNLDAVAGSDNAALVKAVFHVLRPHGGTACLRIAADELTRLAKQAGLASAEVKPAGRRSSLLIREGALPGAADWTHHYADAAASVVSKDQRVKAPLGLLWFGGPPNDEVLPRHGHGPSPQVAAGRLLIEGRNMLRALDIYTGRLLWQKELRDLGKFFASTGHQPGAGEIGSNYVSLPDAVYVAYGPTILELDPAGGESRREFKLEAGPDGSPPRWGYLAAWNDLLVATSTPVKVAAPAAPGTPGAAADGFEPLVKPNDQWQYLAGADPAEAWRAVDFDAKGWKTGTAGFGYGDHDDRTVLKDMRRKYTRVYLRKSFAGKTAADASQATLVINYDDAFIAYLNGQEIARAGVAVGRGKSAEKIASHEAEGHETFPIKNFRKLLRPGRNVIAIEGHNVNPDSSDFSLDPYALIKKGNEKDPAKPQTQRPPLQELLTPVRYSSASRRLVVFNRRTGEQLWDREATYGFRHNNIAVGAGKLFCIDGMSKTKREALRRRGLNAADYKPRLLALNVRTGQQIWSTGEDVFGTFLNYSTEHDVLLQAGSAFRDRSKDESDTGMAAYRGKDGEVLWKDLKRKSNGPCMLHHDTIICQGPAYSLLTGQPKMRESPLTGQPLPWRFTRNYGCNTAIGSEHLLTFRSAAAGFCDLAGDGGTGNLGGFRSSCTSNLIVAGGLLNAPEYTRSCPCRYQNQTSLALVHDPKVEMWTFNAFAWDGRPVRRVGLNFGAPGDRRADDGTLWLDYPSSGGPSPDIPVQLDPEQADYFRYHSSCIQTTPGSPQFGWVAASGVRGLKAVTLTLADDAEPRTYTVRLHFAEVEPIGPGRRVFNVSLQGNQVLGHFDIVKQASGANRAVVMEFEGIEVPGRLNVSLAPSGGEKSLPPVLCGIEVVAEGW